MDPKPREQTFHSWIYLFVLQKRIYKPQTRLVDHPVAGGWVLGQGTEVLVGATLVPISPASPQR